MAVLKAQLSPRYAHLHVVYSKSEEAPPQYPESNYWVVNTRTSIGYWALPYVCDLVGEEVITSTIFDDDSKLKEWLKIHQIRLEPRYSFDDELGLLESKT
jgi:hypothetical protein